MYFLVRGDSESRASPNFVTGLRISDCHASSAVAGPRAAQGAGEGGGGALTILHAVVVQPLTSHPYKAGTEHAVFRRIGLAINYQAL